MKWKISNLRSKRVWSRRFNMKSQSTTIWQRKTNKLSSLKKTTLKINTKFWSRKMKFCWKKRGSSTLLKSSMSHCLASLSSLIHMGTWSSKDVSRCATSWTQSWRKFWRRKPNNSNLLTPKHLRRGRRTYPLFLIKLGRNFCIGSSKLNHPISRGKCWNKNLKFKIQS